MKFRLLLALVAFFGSALPARSTENADIGAPQVFEYRDGFGETERYLIVLYFAAANQDQRRPSVAWPSATTADGTVLNDGFRPIVQGAFCARTDCGSHPVILSTAEVVARRPLPNENLPAMAVFRLPGDAPERVTISRGSEEATFALGKDRVTYRKIPASPPRRRAPAIASSAQARVPFASGPKATEDPSDRGLGEEVRPSYVASTRIPHR